PPAGKIHGLVLVMSEATTPSDIRDTVLEAGGLLRSLAPHGRVITISKDPHAGGDVAARATQAGVDGFLRSLAKEMRAGATANGILIGADVGVGAPSVASALHFFLSVKSAFVAGQFVRITSRRGKVPADWDAPLAGEVAVVTGAARGIGESIARVLAR